MSAAQTCRARMAEACAGDLGTQFFAKCSMTGTWAAMRNCQMWAAAPSSAWGAVPCRATKIITVASAAMDMATGRKALGCRRMAGKFIGDTLVGGGAKWPPLLYKVLCTQKQMTLSPGNIPIAHERFPSVGYCPTTRISQAGRPLTCTIAFLLLQPLAPPPMIDPINPRRLALGAAKKLIFDNRDPGEALQQLSGLDSLDDPPRLTTRSIEKTRMSRTRASILNNLDEMYREAFERAKTSADPAQMTALDFAYRREQLYFEVLLDVRDALERNS